MLSRQLILPMSAELVVDLFAGDRIAQARIVAAPRVEFEAVEQLSITERGAGGFGSSGA